jgi:cell division protein FtsL
MSARGAVASLLPIGRPALLVAVAAAVGIFHVWSHTRVVTAGYRLGELQRSRAALQAGRNRLEVEVATLRTPGRLERFARERLGMAPPAAGAVVAGRVGGSEAGRAGVAGVEASHRPTPAEPGSSGGGAPSRRDGRLASREGKPGRSLHP